MILHGDSLELLKELPDNSIDAIVTDPPYGLSFMGKKWDYDVPKVDFWVEVLRVLKPGGHALVACGTRTQHRMAVNLEDAGFEIRDIVGWVYGSGFPKSHDISKAIDREAGAEREVVGEKIRADGTMRNNMRNWQNDRSSGHLNGIALNNTITAPATEEAAQWEGYGTALKPAMELFTLCRKPISEGTVAQNCLAWGTGALNIDGCRISHNEEIKLAKRIPFEQRGAAENKMRGTFQNRELSSASPQGRFPANLIHDGSEEVVRLFPYTKNGGQNDTCTPKPGMFGVGGTSNRQYVGDSGSAARFFYAAKASKSERGEGNNHPTVKPLALMRYLVRLITRPNQIVLDPFGGSGTTAIACIEEGRQFIIMEREEEYIGIIKKRIAEATKNPKLF